MGDSWVGWRAAGLGVGVGVGALLAWWAWRRLTHSDTPTRWEEVGEVSQLTIYPLKSGRRVSVNEAEATRYGLALDLLEDRSFVAVDSENQIVRGQFSPKLFTVNLTLEGPEVMLQANGEEEALEFDLQDVVKEGKVTEVMYFRDSFGKGYDCGEAAAAWLTRVLQEKKKKKVRLVYNGDLTRERQLSAECFGREFCGDMYLYPNCKTSDRVVYAQHAPYLLTSETSLADLNARMLKPVTQDWFRPNIVVSGVSKAYDEDDWAFVRVGDVVFRRLKPCDRFVYVDPESGKVAWEDSGDVMKKTLAMSHHMDGPSLLQNHWKRWPAFGSLLGIDTCGRVRVGDKVAVARASWNPRWRL